MFRPYLTIATHFGPTWQLLHVSAILGNCYVSALLGNCYMFRPYLAIATCFGPAWQLLHVSARLGNCYMFRPYLAIDICFGTTWPSLHKYLCFETVALHYNVSQCISMLLHCRCSHENPLSVPALFSSCGVRVCAPSCIHQWMQYPSCPCVCVPPY
jgi:hypothetical protein